MPTKKDINLIFNVNKIKIIKNLSILIGLQGGRETITYKSGEISNIQIHLWLGLSIFAQNMYLVTILRVPEILMYEEESIGKTVDIHGVAFLYIEQFTLQHGLNAAFDFESDGLELGRHRELNDQILPLVELDGAEV